MTCVGKASLRGARRRLGRRRVEGVSLLAHDRFRPAAVRATLVASGRRRPSPWDLVLTSRDGGRRIPA
jgi:hypothetical protein